MVIAIMKELRHEYAITNCDTLMQKKRVLDTLTKGSNYLNGEQEIKDFLRTGICTEDE